MLILLLACRGPVSGTYLTTQLTDWEGTCTTTDLPLATYKSAVNVDVGELDMALSDSGGSYPCSLDDKAFLCVLEDADTSYVDLEGRWTSNTAFEGTFHRQVFCEGVECMVEDCASEADFVATLQ